MMQSDEQITIGEMAARSGLSEHTLRYYEKIGLIPPVKRHVSSQQRQYSSDIANTIESLACLRASGLGVKDMRAYLHARGAKYTRKELFMKRKQELAREIEILKLKYRYTTTKIAYHTALEEGHKLEAERALSEAAIITDKIRAYDGVDHEK